jgi:hypothetical protein
MMRARRLTFSTLAVFSLCVPALAAECTVEDRSTLEDVLAQAPSCAAAYKMFEDCALGGSGDVPLGDTVQEKCEGGFLSKLDAAKKSAYNKQLAACDRKYAKREGTMYRSATAFCRAGAARDYAKKYAR